MNNKDDDVRLQGFIDKSKKLNEENDYWFSRQNQNKMVLNFAAKLFVADPTLSPDKAIEQSQSLVDTFYKKVLQKTTKNYNRG